MTGKFTGKDELRCAHYARFFQNLTLTQANGLFWTLFVFVVLVMCISSLQHHKSIAITARDATLPPRVVASPRHKLKNRRARMKMLSIASLCLLLSATATVFEIFALFNIQFCDGEDLMQLYWGFWSVLQVGSNIAILGVMLQFWILLGDVETPSWAVALGTPVLVFAALGFLFRAIWKRVLGKITGRDQMEDKQKQPQDEESAGADEWEDDGDAKREKRSISRSMSTAPTIVEETANDRRYASPSPQPPPKAPQIATSSFNDRSPVSRPPPNVRYSNIWSRDLQYLLSSVVHGEHDHERGPREVHIHHHHTREDSRI